MNSNTVNSNTVNSNTMTCANMKGSLSKLSPSPSPSMNWFLRVPQSVILRASSSHSYKIVFQQLMLSATSDSSVLKAIFTDESTAISSCWFLLLLITHLDRTTASSRNFPHSVSAPSQLTRQTPLPSYGILDSLTPVSKPNKDGEFS